MAIVNGSGKSVGTGGASANAASRKRNSPWGAHSGDRLGKRRSSKACLSCRSRKVRCDVVNGGVPCTNCRLDELDCVLKESNRGRKPGTATRPRARAGNASPRPSIRVAGIQESDSRQQPTAQPEQSAQARRSNQSPCAQQFDCPDEFFASSQVSADQDLPHKEGERMGDVGIRTPRQSQQTRHLASTDGTPLSTAARDGHDGIPSDAAELDGGELPSRLPSYIRSIPLHLDDKDLEYLTGKLCLEIPDDEFRDELLRVFITVVYPFMPAIELEDFIDSIYRCDGGNPVSLLLFQSVMFVSIAFVDSEFLQTRGYHSRKVARKAFFDRVRILHGVNYETDRLALIQSLLLMTYWYDCPDDDQDTWYWMGIAITKAHVIGLHRNPDQLNISAQEKRLRRRVWWCCIMRDRILALTIRQPPRIRDNEYSVRVLNLDDFDTGPPSSVLVDLFTGSIFACPDSKEQKSLAKLCVELTKLCLILGRLLNVVYTVMGSYQGGSEYLLKGTARPKRSHEQEKTLEKCAADLEVWLEQQDDHSRYIIGSSEPALCTTENKQTRHLARFHQAQLYLIYLITLGTFNRPQLYCGTLDRNGSCFGKESAREHVADAVVDLTKLGFDLQRKNQIRYLSTTAVPAFFTATVVHLLDTRSNDEETRNLSLGRLYQCVHVLQQLQEMYSSADYAIHFINSILRNNSSGLQAASLFINVSGLGKVEGEWRSRTEPYSMDMGPSRVAVACMYPSPSTSGNLDMSVDQEEVNAENSVPNTVRQQPTPLSNTIEAWAGTGGADPCSIQLPHGPVADAPFSGTWCEVDSFLPELMGFEDDAGAFLAGDVSVPL